MSTTELLPCPFCGGEATETSPEERGDGYWRIACTYCGVRMGGTHRTMNREAWNTRAERTCELDGTISFEWQAISTTFYTHSLSCGHDVTTTEPEPPNYCEECGAKVVGQ